MNDTDDIPLKVMITQALETCADLSLLDLIYKLLVYETDPPVVGKM